MTIEEELRDVVTDQQRNERFKQQVKQFRRFEKRMTESGVVIERKTFTIPLMERLSYCGLVKYE